MPDPCLKPNPINSLEYLQIVVKEWKRLHSLVCCTLILCTTVPCFIYLPLVEFGVVFFLNSLFCFPLCFVCTSKLRIIKAVFKWWKYNYGINPASWNFRFCCSPKERIHVAAVEDIAEDPLGGSMLLLLFMLRKCTSNLQTQRFSFFFWPSWYSPPTKISSKLDNSSWEAWRALKC